MLHYKHTNSKGKFHMPYNASVAKKAYYKLPATTLTQLEKNLVRLVANQNMSHYAKQAVIKNQFKMYKETAQELYKQLKKKWLHYSILCAIV